MKAGRQHHTTIIKRSGRKAHHGAHGGAWKVAFADFTLAMMALFMVLWIISSVSEDERREIVAQMHHTSFFDNSDFNPFAFGSHHGSAPVSPQIEVATEPEVTTSSLPTAQAELRADGGSINSATRDAAPPLADPAESLSSVISRSDSELEKLRQVILNIATLYNAQNNLSLEKVPQGLRILIQDDSDRTMFPRGSAVLMPYFARLLTELAPVFNRIDNQIMITGHTDAARYSDNAAYNNWNLSGDRALAARRMLERGGLESARVIQVNAMAARMPLDQQNPLSDRNRRIEIMVLTEAAAETLYQFYGHQGEKVVKPAMQRIQ